MYVAHGTYIKFVMIFVRQLLLSVASDVGELSLLLLSSVRVVNDAHVQ